MNDSHTDDQLRELFRPHRESVATHATEADLDAARSRSIAGQRGRVLGGTAAVAILAVGGGALALTGGGSSSTDIVRSASIEESGANAAGPTADRIQPTPNAQTDDGSSSETADDDEIDTWLADFPLPPVFGADGIPTLPLTEFDDAASGDGLPRFQVEFERFVEAQQVVVQEWSGDVADWLDARPDGDIVIGPERILEAGPFTDFIADDLAGIDPDVEAEFEKLADIEVTIGDDSIEIDIDGDGVPDTTITFDEIDDMWSKIGDLDVGDLGLDEIELDFDELDSLLEELRAELDGIELRDIDEVLEAFDLDDFDWKGGTLPDLSELELPEGMELPTEAELEELLEQLETELDGLDLDDLDLDDLDLDDLDLDGLGLDDLDLGDLFDSDQFEQTLDELFGN